MIFGGVEVALDSDRDLVLALAWSTTSQGVVYPHWEHLGVHCLSQGHFKLEYSWSWDFNR